MSGFLTKLLKENLMENARKRAWNLRVSGPVMEAVQAQAQSINFILREVFQASCSNSALSQQYNDKLVASLFHVVALNARVFLFLIRGLRV